MENGDIFIDFVLFRLTPTHPNPGITGQFKNNNFISLIGPYAVVCHLLLFSEIGGSSLKMTSPQYESIPRTYLCQRYQPRREHSREKIINFVTARTPYTAGTNHLPRKLNKLICRFFQSLWPGHYFWLISGGCF